MKEKILYDKPEEKLKEVPDIYDEYEFIELNRN